MPRRRTGDRQTSGNRVFLRSTTKTARATLETYIRTHLAYAGTIADIFTEKAFDEIYNYSLGSARLTNKACTHCLMLAAQQGRKIVDDYLVRDVIEGELP